jgi:hypothetical protein
MDVAVRGDSSRSRGAPAAICHNKFLILVLDFLVFVLYTFERGKEKRDESLALAQVDTGKGANCVRPRDDEERQRKASPMGPSAPGHGTVQISRAVFRRTIFGKKPTPLPTSQSSRGG